VIPLPEEVPVVTTDPEVPVDAPTDDLPPVDPPADDDPDKGAKAALIAEREARRLERAEARRDKAELEALREQIANKDKPAEEQALEAARREARQEAQTAFNQRLVQAELKAALANAVNDTTLALAVIDASVIDVDANGEVDAQSVTDAIEAALAKYPILKATDPKKFGGTADQGLKGGAVQPQQLTREQIKSLSPEQIVAAQEAGQLRSIGG
jgi:hypothetical protein